MANVVVNSNVCIGDCTTLQSNSLIEHDTILGQYNFVGMASNLVKGLGNNEKVYGNPAKKIFEEND